MEHLDTSAEPFSITYVTYSKSSRQGGTVKRYSNCISTGTRNKGERKQKVRTTVQVPTGTTKRPDHFKNATRNLQLLPSRQIRKLHIWLIIEFNGKKVIL